jgi:hypothetical protein
MINRRIGEIPIGQVIPNKKVFFFDSLVAMVPVRMLSF